MDRFFEWLQTKTGRDGAGRDDALLTATRAFMWLIGIHPFADGNGRTTRLVADYLLMRAGLPPGVWAPLGPPFYCGVEAVLHRADARAALAANLDLAIARVG